MATAIGRLAGGSSLWLVWRILIFVRRHLEILLPFGIRQKYADGGRREVKLWKACACVCVCVRERKEKIQRNRGAKMGMIPPCALLFQVCIDSASLKKESAAYRNGTD